MTLTTIVLGIIAALVVALALFMRRASVKGNEIDELRDNIETTKRMRDADVLGDDPAASKRWLAERLRNGPGK